MKNETYFFCSKVMCTLKFPDLHFMLGGMVALIRLISLKCWNDRCMLGIIETSLAVCLRQENIGEELYLRFS